MTTSDVPQVLQVPARTIPVPGSVSPQVQAVLAKARPYLIDFPGVDDFRGGRRWSAPPRGGCGDFSKGDDIRQEVLRFIDAWAPNWSAQ